MDLHIHICHAVTVGVEHWALWQPPRYAGSWPSCPSCSSRQRAWDCLWLGTQMMLHLLILRSGLWESWWILGELRERERKGGRKMSEGWGKIKTRHQRATNELHNQQQPSPLTTPHFTVSDWSGRLVFWWLCVVLTSWVSSRGQTEGLPVGHK